jgi:hypothetical protein
MSHEVAEEELTIEEKPTLYAGKYTSVEELEKAYKNSAKVFNDNKVLQEKLKNYEAPDNYCLPEISLPGTVLEEVEALAKTAGLSQEQFNKTLYAMAEQQKNYQTHLDNKKKTLGDELNVVQDYVTKTYPASLHTMRQESIAKAMRVEEPTIGVR